MLFGHPRENHKIKVAHIQCEKIHQEPPWIKIGTLLNPELKPFNQNMVIVFTILRFNLESFFALLAFFVLYTKYKLLYDRSSIVEASVVKIE